MTGQLILAGRRRRQRRRATAIGMLTALLAIGFALSLMIGHTFYGPGEVLPVIFGADVPGASFTVGELRLPRAALAVLGGFAFGIAGAAFQTMLGNPLASPDILGISSGAGAAAVIAIILLGLILIGMIVGAIVLVPKLIGSAPEQTSVPSVRNLTQQQAVKTIEDKGLTVGDVTQAASAEVDQGRVISQTPDGGDLVNPRTSVDLVISSGPPQVSLPDVVGDNKDEASATLQAQGFKVTLREKESDEPKDEVVEMNPSGGSQVATGAQVTLFYSDGPEEVPNVVGKTEKEARGILTKAGFKVEKVDDPTTVATAGTVTRQVPNTGTLDKGSTVTIVVSTYTPPSATPTPTPTPTATPSPTDLPLPLP